MNIFYKWSEPCGDFFDEQSARALLNETVSRAKNIAVQITNPFNVDAGEPWCKRLKMIKVPTLIVHGTKDPLFPFDHAEALHHEIPNSEVLTLEGSGHGQIPKDMWNAVITNIAQLGR